MGDMRICIATTDKGWEKMQEVGAVEPDIIRFPVPGNVYAEYDDCNHDRANSVNESIRIASLFHVRFEVVRITVIGFEDENNSKIDYETSGWGDEWGHLDIHIHPVTDIEIELTDDWVREHCYELRGNRR